MDVVRRADWIVDIGPGAGEAGGRVLYSGPIDGFGDVSSATADYLFGRAEPVAHSPREPQGWLHLGGVTRHNLRDVSVDIPLCVLTAVTGVSGSGKSTLVTQVLASVMRRHFGVADDEEAEVFLDVREVSGIESFDRIVVVDQRPIGRTPRSNLATYTGMFDAVRKLYADTDEARARGYSAGRFSFNVAEGRCEVCQGEGFVAVELLFLPGTYAPCPACGGARYNPETLEVTYRDRTIADVLAMSVDDAAVFLADVPAAARSLETLRAVGLGYLRLGQPATELSGGEAQRIKLATELQRAHRGHALYLLDEPTSGLHPADIALLLRQLHRLVDAGNTVVLVEHDLDVIASADWVIDLGPGGGDAGGHVIASGPPGKVARAKASATGSYLAAHLTSGPPQVR
jgi:excinuclease ABC subunit A